MKTYQNLGEYSTGIQKEVRKINKKFDAKSLAKLFNLTVDGARKKINKNSFTVEEAIVIMITYYKREELDFNKLIELFTWKPNEE